VPLERGKPRREHILDEYLRTHYDDDVRRKNPAANFVFRSYETNANNKTDALVIIIIIIIIT